MCMPCTHTHAAMRPCGQYPQPPSILISLKYKLHAIGQTQKRRLITLHLVNVIAFALCSAGKRCECDLFDSHYARTHTHTIRFSYSLLPSSMQYSNRGHRTYTHYQGLRLFQHLLRLFCIFWIMYTRASSSANIPIVIGTGQNAPCDMFAC